ncbi:DMT family transporter [Methylocella silvestris]|uniref:EamA family transporter n=1 Tax=Methylocella silvestris TaxID=199596 RepID=A0A2J7TJI6_METSI|nr:DMT family transporter [Methylocella silvestris]PNG26933.1 EamA family transporter [Methylocella silvestris]
MTLRKSGDSQGIALYYAILVAATFLMASSFIAGKILLAYDVPAFLLVGWRFVLAALAAALVLYLTTDDFRAALAPRRLDVSDWLTVAAIGVLQTAMAMGLLFWAMESIAPPTAAILLFTNPLWVALIGHAALGERLSGLRLTGLALGVCGVALALGGGFSLREGAIGGELLGLGAALSWTASTLLNKRARLPIETWALTFWQMLIGALALLIVAFARGETWPAHLPLSAWGWFLWLAIPGSTASFGLWFLALTKGGATRSSGYLFLAPLFTVILSAALLGSTLSAAQGAGGVLIGCALWMINQSPPKAGAAAKLES